MDSELDMGPLPVLGGGISALKSKPADSTLLQAAGSLQAPLSTTWSTLKLSSGFLKAKFKQAKYYDERLIIRMDSL